MRYLFIFLFYIVTILPLQALTIKEKIINARVGDFIVTQQLKTYTVLSIRSLTDKKLVLEEISIPENQIDADKIAWGEWVKEGAPGHTSWIAFEFDLQEDKLIESYSFTRKGWLYIEESEYLFAKLLTLPLSKIPKDELRRIGPAPSAGAEDHRAVWMPPLTRHGKKVNRPHFEVWRGLWPQDESQLSGSRIELYFDTDHTAFPFPFWIEFKESHFAFKIRTVDAGSYLASPKGEIPSRPPRFAGLMKRIDGSVMLPIKAPSYYKRFALVAIDLTAPMRCSIAVPCQVKKGKSEDQLSLVISQKELNELLIEGHRYQWGLMCDDKLDTYVEAEEPFVWKK